MTTKRSIGFVYLLSPPMPLSSSQSPLSNGPGKWPVSYRASNKIWIFLYGVTIRSIILYGCETWAVAREEIRRIEAFEMRWYRRMEKISRTDRIINEEEFLEKVSERKSIWKSV